MVCPVTALPLPFAVQLQPQLVLDELCVPVHQFNAAVTAEVTGAPFCVVRHTRKHAEFQLAVALGIPIAGPESWVRVGFDHIRDLALDDARFGVDMHLIHVRLPAVGGRGQTGSVSLSRLIAEAGLSSRSAM